MAQVTIYNNDPANVQISVVNGDPPVDQSALVAQLQAELTAANTKLANGLTAANASVTAAQASLTSAQAVVSALS
jgi:hypothetical protein